MFNSKKKIDPGTPGKLPNLTHSIYRGFALLSNFTEDNYDGLPALDASVRMLFELPQIQQLASPTCWV